MILQKWYADVVDAGRVTVLYRANLKLGPAVFGYARTFDGSGGEDTIVRVGGVALPQPIDGSLAWPAHDPQDSRDWRWAGCQDREIGLWRRDRQSLSWNPLVLNGVVSGRALSPAARGYVERLSLDFGPWRLGLQCLKWGRFCGHAHSLVWIEWQGSNALRLALVDGQRRAVNEITHGVVRCDGARLALSNLQPLVKARMSDGALRGLHLPHRLGALQFFRGVESKWLAAAELSLDDGTADSGHAVFEEVVWP